MKKLTTKISKQDELNDDNEDKSITISDSSNSSIIITDSYINKFKDNKELEIEPTRSQLERNFLNILIELENENNNNNNKENNDNDNINLTTTIKTTNNDTIDYDIIDDVDENDYNEIINNYFIM